MVGRTLAAKGKPYRYHRCRHVYDKNTGQSCSARYIRCERLEDAVWKEVKRVLTNPDVILHELQRQSKVKVDASEVERLESVLTGLKERETRLVHLYTLGEVREETLRNESAGIASRRMASWLNGAGETEKDLVLEALQIGVTATVEETRISGVLPVELPSFLLDESEQEYPDFEVTSGIPFGRDFRSG